MQNAGKGQSYDYALQISSKQHQPVMQTPADFALCAY